MSNDDKAMYLIITLFVGLAGLASGIIYIAV